MDFNSIGAPTLTEYTGAIHPEHGVTDIVIVGHIPGSDEWNRIDKKINPQPKTTQVYHDKGGARTEHPIDPQAGQKRIKRLAMAVTEIRGIDNWEFSTEATIALFEREDAYWLVNGWEDHLNDSKKHVRPSSTIAETPAKRGSKSEAG